MSNLVCAYLISEPTGKCSGFCRLHSALNASSGQEGGLRIYLSDALLKIGSEVSGPADFIHTQVLLLPQIPDEN